LAGKPLIVYSIEAALASKKIGRLIVSTDDDEIAAVSREYGAEVPFLRPHNLAEDTTPDQPVFQHSLDWLRENENYTPKIVLNLRPTTPFKTPQIIDEVIQTIVDTRADVVRTMSRVEGVHHPYWMYLLDDGQACPYMKDLDLSDYYQRQLLPQVYRINGVVDAIKTSLVYEGNILHSNNMRGVVISDYESIDIDTEFDFMLCECMLNLKCMETKK
jgi:CMP-N-acetylneuraminic acid synthetase